MIEKTTESNVKIAKLQQSLEQQEPSNLHAIGFAVAPEEEEDEEQEDEEEDL